MPVTPGADSADERSKIVHYDCDVALRELVCFFHKNHPEKYANRFLNFGQTTSSEPPRNEANRTVNAVAQSADNAHTSAMSSTVLPLLLIFAIVTIESVMKEGDFSTIKWFLEPGLQRQLAQLVTAPDVLKAARWTLEKLDPSSVLHIKVEETGSIFTATVTLNINLCSTFMKPAIGLIEVERAQKPTVFPERLMLFGRCPDPRSGSGFPAVFFAQKALRPGHLIIGDEVSVITFFQNVLGDPSSGNASFTVIIIPCKTLPNKFKRATMFIPMTVEANLTEKEIAYLAALITSLLPSLLSDKEAQQVFTAGVAIPAMTVQIPQKTASPLQGLTGTFETQSPTGLRSRRCINVSELGASGYLEVHATGTTGAAALEEKVKVGRSFGEKKIDQNSVCYIPPNATHLIVVGVTEEPKKLTPDAVCTVVDCRDTRVFAPIPANLDTLLTSENKSLLPVHPLAIPPDLLRNYKLLHDLVVRQQGGGESTDFKQTPEAALYLRGFEEQYTPLPPFQAIERKDALRYLCLDDPEGRQLCEHMFKKTGARYTNIPFASPWEYGHPWNGILTGSSIANGLAKLPDGHPFQVRALQFIQGDVVALFKSLDSAKFDGVFTQMSCLAYELLIDSEQEKLKDCNQAIIGSIRSKMLVYLCLAILTFPLDIEWLQNQKIEGETTFFDIAKNILDLSDEYRLAKETLIKKYSSNTSASSATYHQEKSLKDCPALFNLLTAVYKLSLIKAENKIVVQNDDDIKTILDISFSNLIYYGLDYQKQYSRTELADTLECHFFRFIISLGLKGILGGKFPDDLKRFDVLKDIADISRPSGSGDDDDDDDAGDTAAASASCS